MKIRPLHDRIIVKRLEEERKTASGIVIPDTAAEKPDQGEVKAVGKGKKTDDGKIIPLDVKVGDRVLFGTDWPSPGVKSLRRNLDEVAALPLGAELIDKIVRANALRLFPPK